MQKKIVIGNWKMNPPSLKEAEKIFKKISESVPGLKKTLVIVSPPFLYLEKLKGISRKISLGAQDAFSEEAGPFTGEISPAMLYNLGARYVILGHSERRALGESNLRVNKKLKAALAAGLNPILCVGENSRDENHGYFNVVRTQVSECLEGVPKNLIAKVTIAYEPIWAISSTADRRDATPKDSEEMTLFIKKTLVDKFGLKIKMPRILYGGDVNEKNAGEFLQEGGVDGVLVGRASLDAEKFSQIIKIAESAE